MAEPRPTFQTTQYAFAAYIRDPERNPPPAGVAIERMQMYRELFFNNVKSFIGSGFPVLQEVLDEALWLDLAQDFFARHRSRTPYFVEFAEEFLQYLREERGHHPEDPPFLLELAHYEWVELALTIAEGEAPAENPQLEQNPLAGAITLSELAWPLAYRFPVQRISRDFQPLEPPAEPTCLAVYRDRDEQVRFLELNPVTFRLLQLLEENGALPAEQCLKQIAEELGHADPSAVLNHGADILRGLARRGVIGAAS
ncbi:MAG: putative DNA-binding domain-containing protein [Methylococcaceae bacterium]|nr:putative DNA-binding domain-containing protein [Methylococcaceae bacterium]